MGSQRLEKDRTRLWALPAPPWVLLLSGLLGRWGQRSAIPGLPTPGTHVESLACQTRPPRCPASHVQGLCAWLEKGPEWTLPWFTVPPLVGGTVGKEETLMFRLFVLFTTSWYLSHLKFKAPIPTAHPAAPRLGVHPRAMDEHELRKSPPRTLTGSSLVM